MDVVDCHRFTLWAFQSSNRTSSFRTPVPSPQFLEHLEELKREDPSQYHATWTTTTTTSTKRVDAKWSKKNVKTAESEGGKDGEEESVKHELSREDQRRLRKLQRMAEVCTYSIKGELSLYKDGNSCNPLIIQSPSKVGMGERRGWGSFS